MKFFILFLMLANSVYACPVGEHGFFMSRLKSFSVPGPSESGLTEDDFKQVLTRVKEHYESAFTELGLGVLFEMDWNNTWINAQTGWSGDKTVRFFFSGELARIKYMTLDGMMFTACHEFGHHFGGIPKKQWATTEGGADYFAALKCMRDILKNDPANAEAVKLELPEAAVNKCREVYSNDDEFHICLRAVKAGESMMKALKYSKTREEPGSLLFVDLPAVETTRVDYPSYECRAETAYQGAICNKGPEIPVSYTNEADGYCHEKNGDTFGMRPQCWFKPTLE
jgi:hypothetical protein